MIQNDYGWDAAVEAGVLSIKTYPVVCHAHMTADVLLRFLADPDRCPFRTSIDRHCEWGGVGRGGRGGARGWASLTSLTPLPTPACRYAVMFNTALSHAQMASMVRNLGQVDNWQTCAHGRPTVVPIRIVERG